MLIDSEVALDEALTRPSQALIRFISTIPSPLVVLGAGGKMGPTLCVMAKRAAEAARHRLVVVAVSRFSDEASRMWLEERGVRTIPCDVLDREAVGRLPDAGHVVYLVGMKFGTKQNPSLTWAINTLAPAIAVERYAGARVVALSTGNVYPFVDAGSAGATEEIPLAPIGEYANACLGRERIYRYASERFQTPLASVRLNYAVELRYGVLVDLAQRIARGEPVDLTMGYLNCIWQRDANDMILRSFPLAGLPAAPVNLTGTATLSVRHLAQRLGALMDLPVAFAGSEAPTALLNDARKTAALLGEPETALESMLSWTANWVKSGGTTHGKPTHFQVRDGGF
ncbi:MAG: NAD-dependent epimerase/dehydratase family protein [Rhodothermales bacterium]